MYRDVPPAGIIVQTQVHVILQRKGEPVHERRAGGDGVAVPCLTGLRLGNLDALQHRPTHFTILLPSQHIPDMRTTSL